MNGNIAIVSRNEQAERKTNFPRSWLVNQDHHEKKVEIKHDCDGRPFVAPRRTRVAVIGTGNVGATCAYGLLMNAVANDVILVDVNRDKAQGEAMDLEHALPFMCPSRILVSELDDCIDCDVVVVTAGAGRKPGESRLDLAKKNAAMFREMIPRITRANSRAIFVIASNPVDVLTYLMVRESGLAPRQVIGSGTILDTARFRALLSQHFGVDPRSVHAHIIGEHGDTEVPVWSLANIGGMRLHGFARHAAYASTKRRWTVSLSEPATLAPRSSSEKVLLSMQLRQVW